MGASLALAGVSACTRQPERDASCPYVRQPEEIVPGRPLFFATAMPQGGFGHPLLAENHMGRPTKLEGNPEHPASLGATDIFGQAAVLTLYDPDRSRTVVGPRRSPKTWGAFLAAITGGRQHAARAQGRGPAAADRADHLAVAHRSDSARCSPALPEAKWHQWDPVYGVRQGGAPATSALYRFDKADVIVSLDADFLGFGPGAVRYTKDFSSRRRMGTPQDALNRLYASSRCRRSPARMPIIGWRSKARDVQAFAAAVAAAVGVPGASAVGALPPTRRSGSRRLPPTSPRTRAGPPSSPAITSRRRCTRSRAR